jgi:hypothetical protein
MEPEKLGHRESNPILFLQLVMSIIQHGEEVECGVQEYVPSSLAP